MASGLLARGAVGAPPPSSAAINAGDDFWQLAGGTGSNATIAVGGTVTFAYPDGFDEHNARFTRTGVRCTQTAGYGSVVDEMAIPADPEEPGWSGVCTFDRSGSFTFVCDVHPEMQGTVTVVGTDGPAATPTPTPTPSAPPGSGGTPPGGGSPGGPAAPPASGGGAPPSPVVRLARRQKGTVVRGTVTRAGDRSKVVVDVRTRRGAIRVRGRKHALVRVGRLTTRTAPDGRRRFKVRLSARARAALRRKRTLALRVRVTITLPLIGRQAETHRVLLRRA